MSLYRDDAVVLRTYKLGEADRIVVLLTKGSGKVRAVAKGVRRSGSRFGGRLEPTSHVAVQLWAGRELDIVSQIETVDAFRAVREDLDRLNQALPLLEVVDQVALEREPAPELHRMLVGALRALERGPSPLLVGAFFWKLLALEGIAPELEACVACGADEGLVAFSLDEGGMLCPEHRQGRVSRPLSDEARELIGRVLGGQLGAALAEPASTATAEVEAVATAAVERHVERKLRSLHVLS